MMWSGGWRQRLWERIRDPWDVIILGGGISGAGVFREASRRGLKVLLLERDDFAAATSSASSKLVHGGLRYLAQGQWRVTRTAVREREHLLRAAPGLVEPLEFLLPLRRGMHPLLMGIGLSAYDFLAGRSAPRHRRVGRDELATRLPLPLAGDLRGAYRFRDAVSDDARLVFRLLAEGLGENSAAANYIVAERLLAAKGRVCGVAVRDRILGRHAELHARVVIDATGTAAGRLDPARDPAPHLRPLRGSHLVFPFWRLPLPAAMILRHPRDGRFLFAFPWLGRTLLGTTDLDHASGPVVMSRQEGAYLIAALTDYFPGLGLDTGAALASYSGLRAIVGSGHGAPSSASREEAIWHRPGLVGVAGGKLTSFRRIAHAVLRQAAAELGPAAPTALAPAFDAVAQPPSGRLTPGTWHHLLGRHGRQAPALLAQARSDALAPVADTEVLWAELGWSAQNEAVEHLDDLLLRRTRLGLLLPAGGSARLKEIGARIRPLIGWDQTCWESEVKRYRALWSARHRPEGYP